MKDNKLSRRNTKNLVDLSLTEEQLKLKKAVMEFESERDLCDTSRREAPLWHLRQPTNDYHPLFRLVGRYMDG
jgi:hypothetical protein